jgi:hypothetical protein
MGKVVVIGSETNVLSAKIRDQTVAYVSACARTADLQAELLGVTRADVTQCLQLSPQTVRVSATRHRLASVGPAVYTKLPDDFLARTSWTALRGVPAELATAVVFAIIYRVNEVVWLGRRDNPPELPAAFRECLKRRGISVRFAR